MGNDLWNMGLQLADRCILFSNLYNID